MRVCEGGECASIDTSSAPSSARSRLLPRCTPRSWQHTKDKDLTYSERVVGMRGKGRGEGTETEGGAALLIHSLSYTFSEKSHSFSLIGKPMPVADLLDDLLLEGVVFVSSIFVNHHVHVHTLPMLGSCSWIGRNETWRRERNLQIS